MNKDDVPEILDKMIKADVIVLASSIYFVTSQIKTLIDRCYSKFNFLCNKKILFYSFKCSIV